MERAYLGVSREILVILRLSVADVSTLCLSFKNCTVAIYYYVFFRVSFPQGPVPLP